MALRHDQRVLQEDVAVEGAGVQEGPRRSEGARPLRVSATHGPPTASYDALVAVDATGLAPVATVVRISRAAATPPTGLGNTCDWLRLDDARVSVQAAPRLGSTDGGA